MAAFLGLSVGFLMALSGWVSQGFISLLASIFFISSNFPHDEIRDSRFLGLVCFVLAIFNGFGLASTCSILLGGVDSDDRVTLLRLPLFLVFVTLFHAAEFSFAVLFHSKDAVFRAFLLAPVPAGGYSIAMVSAIAEFWIRKVFAGGLLNFSQTIAGALLLLGAVLSFLGWALRTAALFTAQSNFTHLVALRKERSHVLVTEGVYRICRHPGYLGWFVWSVSTQIVLGNTICLIAYGFVSWNFFAGRIPHEEDTLVNFFGDQYLVYARQVPCGIPCISDL
eukprot:TRINITY_DN9450_c2_g1_i1.p1 TRINITY_DN9450_c2_g1~~TRINITY_DN9450_c2_g1_i1.p1  ORF type:complete len:295 (+),score=37.90 TRINITY_DN9450_c2_g1_i1:46-885(+)